MAAVGAELSGFWFPSSGPAGFFILLILLLVFLMSLCSDCNRRSFELKDPEVDRNPSSLIRVVKLEEGRENPMIDEIQNDEKEFGPEGGFIPWRSHLGAPQSQTESRPEEETSVSLPPWRSHLVAPQSHNSAHVYDVINGGRSSSNDASSLTANQSGDPDIPPPADLNSVYARVGKKTNVSDSPAGLPGDSPGGLPGDSPAGLPGDSPGSLPGDSPAGLPGDSPAGLPGDSPAGLPGDSPGSLPGDSPGSLPGDSPGGLPGDSPGGLPGDSPGGLPGDSPGSLPGDSPAGLPGDSPGSLPGDSPGSLPGDSPEEAKGREEEEEPKPPLPDRRTDMN